MRPIITVAKNIDTNRAVHISQVDNGLSCGCICLECSQAMVAANRGKIQQHHFRHYNESNCLGAPETGLHLLAKQILLEAEMIAIGSDEYFGYSYAIAEKKFHGIIPDVRLEDDSKEIWLVEIAVTHPLEEPKLEIIKSTSVNCLELDLKNVDRDITYEALKQSILYDLTLRKVICRKVQKPKLKKEREEQNYWIFAAFSLIAVVLGLSWRKRRKQRRTR
jgi:hypothetical protein